MKAKTMKMILFSFLILILGCKTKQNVAISTLNSAYGNEAAGVIQTLVLDLDENVLTSSEDLESGYVRLLMSVAEIGFEKSINIKSTSKVAFKSQVASSNLLRLAWKEKAIDQIENIKDVSLDTISYSGKMSSYEFDLQGSFFQYLKSNASGDRVVASYISAKEVAVQFSDRQLAQGLLYEMRQSNDFDLDFVKQIIVFEWLVPYLLFE